MDSKWIELSSYMCVSFLHSWKIAPCGDESYPKGSEYVCCTDALRLRGGVAEG